MTEFGNELPNAGMTVTKKWTMKSTEARISKPNFAKITSASSQKKIPAETYCREKQSLLFTEAVLGFQRSTKLIKSVLKLNFCRDRFLSRWGVGFGDLRFGDEWKFETNYFKKYFYIKPLKSKSIYIIKIITHAILQQTF